MYTYLNTETNRELSKLLRCVICTTSFDFSSRYPEKVTCSRACAAKLQFIRYGSGRTVKKPSYKGIHSWINLHFTRPEKCTQCGITPSKGKDGRSKIHWANKSGEYKRDITDWVALCISCHWKYDHKEKNLGKFIINHLKGEHNV